MALDKRDVYANTCPVFCSSPALYLCQQKQRSIAMNAILKIKKTTEYDADGNITRWYEKIYYEKGIKQTEYNPDGSIESWSVSEYGNNGEIVKFTVYNSDGSIRNWIESVYNTKGKLIKHIHHNSQGEIEAIFDY